MNPIQRHADPAVQKEFNNVYRLLTLLLDLQGVERVDTLPSDPVLGKEVWDIPNNRWVKWNGEGWQQLWPALWV